MNKTIALTLLFAVVTMTGCSVSPMGFGEATGGSASNADNLSAGGKQPAADPNKPAFGGLVETTGTPSVIIQGEFDNGKALKQMYGNYNSEAKRSVWKPNKEELGKFNPYGNASSLQSRAVFSKTFQQGERERVFIVTKTSPPRDECEDCVPVLGAALFSKEGDEWRLDAQSKAITRTGMHGELNGGKLVKLAANKYGVLFNWKHTSMGITEEGALLLAETKNGMKEVFSMVTGSNNKAYCQENGLYEDDPECWGYSSKLEFVPATEGAMYELRVVTNGSKMVDQNEVEKVRETRRLFYSDNGYRLAR